MKQSSSPLSIPSDGQREQILAELASLHSIERGSLNEEYRERPAPGGQGVVRKGPYFKHQCWEEGRNKSRRVPAQEAPLLREDLENARRFDQLVTRLAAIAIANSRERRAALGETRPTDTDQQRADADSKKNSSSRASKNATAKPKPFLRKSRSASPKTGSKT